VKFYVCGFDTGSSNEKKSIVLVDFIGYDCFVIDDEG
jgi:hypothetical protein